MTARTQNQPSLEWQRPLWNGVHFTLWILMALVGAVIVWAALARVQVYALVQGRLEPKGKMVEVDTGFGGRVLEVRVRPWDHVKRGDVLAVIDAAGVDAKDTKAQLEKAVIERQSAEQDISLAKVSVHQGSRVVKQQQELFDIGGIPLNDLKIAQENLQKAQLTLQQAVIRLQAAKLEEQRLQQRQRVEIVAPTDGKVAALSAEQIGVVISSGSRVAEIVPDGVPLVLRGFVAEADRPKLRLSARAEVSWTAYPRQKYGFTVGRVAGISPVSSNKYEVLIDFQRLELRGALGEQQLLPGMTAEARAIANTKTALAMFWDWIRGVNPWD